MLNFPYIWGDGSGALQFTNGCIFQYPASVKIPANVTTVSDSAGAFRNHIEVVSIEFDSGSQLGTLGNNSFSGCTGLKSVKFTTAQGLTIPNSCFYGDTSLEVVTFSGSINAGSAISAFFNCYALTQATLEHILSKIGNNQIAQSMFDNCTSITSVTLPDSVTTIGANAFRGCTSLVEIDFNNAIGFNGLGVIANCTSLKKVTFGDIPGSEYNPLSTGNIWSGCTAIEDVVIPSGWNRNLLISNGTSNFTNVLTHDSMVAMINNLYDYSGGTAHALTLGTANLARLSAAEIDIATAKNWSLA